MLSTFPPHPWSHSAILRWFLRLPLSSLLSPSQADRILQYVRPKYRRCYLPAISNMTLLSKKKKKIKKKKKKKGLMHPGLDSYTNTIVKSTTPVSHGHPKRCVVGFTSTGRQNHAVTTVTVTTVRHHITSDNFHAQDPLGDLLVTIYRRLIKTLTQMPFFPFSNSGGCLFMTFGFRSMIKIQIRYWGKVAVLIYCIPGNSTSSLSLWHSQLYFLLSAFYVL